MNRQRSIILVAIMAIVSLVSITIGISYSYLSRLSIGGTSQNIQTGNLSATVTYTPLASTALESLSDSDGINQTSYATISIAKDNQYSVLYSIVLSYSLDSIPGELLPIEYGVVPFENVRVALFDTSNLTTPIAGPVSIGDLPIYSYSSQFDFSHLLYFKNVPSGSSNTTYAIKMWLDENISPEFDNMHTLVDVNVLEESYVGKSVYNISGTVSVPGSNDGSGAIVSLQNGAITTTSTAGGAYTLTGVPEGTYNLSILYDGKEYKTNVHIQSGSSVSVSSGNPAGMPCEDDPYPSCADTFFTTPYRIMKFNGFTSTANSNSFIAPDTAYNVPSSFVITGAESLSVLNISGVILEAAPPFYPEDDILISKS